MHDGPNHHDHDQHELDEEEEHPLWKLDTVILTSVGIDVGTATSQIIFSRLVLRRLGRELSSRFVVTERKTSTSRPSTSLRTPRAASASTIRRLADWSTPPIRRRESLRSKWTPALSFSPARRFAGITRERSPTSSQRSAATCAPARATISKRCFRPMAPARSPCRRSDMSSS